MPLVVYLAVDADVGEDLSRGLAVLQSYILRRDICGLTTKNYIDFLSGSSIGCEHRRAVGRCADHLSLGRQSDIDRWPTMLSGRQAWLDGPVQKPAPPRLRFSLRQSSKQAIGPERKH